MLEVTTWVQHSIDWHQCRSMSIGHPIPEIRLFKIWPWKSKVKVIAQGHKVGITPYQFISLSFHVDQPSHSWDTAISKFDVENSRSRSWVRSKLKVITWVQHSVDSHPFHSMSIGPPIHEIQHFQNLTRPRQFHRTSNGENPSSGYTDMGSASLAAARPGRTMMEIPLQPGGLRGKNLHKTWSVKIDAVLIVFFKLLKCLHIVCATIIYLPIVHVHKFICAGVLRGFASYYQWSPSLHVITFDDYKYVSGASVMGLGHWQWSNSIIQCNIFWVLIQLNDEKIYTRMEVAMNYSSTVCHNYVLCSPNLGWNISLNHQALCVKIKHLEYFFTFPDFIGIIGNFGSI